MLICKKCLCEFNRVVTKGRNLPSYCTRKCYDEDHFIWSISSDEERTKRYKKAFEMQVIKQNGCWDWKGYISPQGYAEIGRSKNCHEKSAHRISWIIHNGMITNKQWVLHKCDNRKCTNPDHLFLGTTQDNTADRHRKGRTLKGSEVKTATINEEIVELVKNELTSGVSCLYVSKKYKISHNIVKRINKDETWKHIPWPTEKIGNGRNGPKKLNEENVKEIKKMLHLGVPCSKLGKDFGVTKEAIQAIKVGKNWKHVTID